jgi:hypothetical protein
VLRKKLAELLAGVLIALIMFAIAGTASATPSGKPVIEPYSSTTTYFFEGPEGTAVEGDTIQVVDTLIGRTFTWYDESGCVSRYKDVGIYKQVMTDQQTGEVVTILNTLTRTDVGCQPDPTEPNAQPGTYPQTTRFSGLNYSVRSKGDRTYTSAGHHAEKITWTAAKCPTPGSGKCGIAVWVYDENGNLIEHYIIPLYVTLTFEEELYFTTPHLQHFFGSEEKTGLWERLAGTYQSPRGPIYPKGPAERL